MKIPICRKRNNCNFNFPSLPQNTQRKTKSRSGILSKPDLRSFLPPNVFSKFQISLAIAAACLSRPTKETHSYVTAKHRHAGRTFSLPPQIHQSCSTTAQCTFICWDTLEAQGGGGTRSSRWPLATHVVGDDGR